MVVGFLTTIATHEVSTAPFVAVPWLTPIMQRDETTLALVWSVRSPNTVQCIFRPSTSLDVSPISHSSFAYCYFDYRVLKFCRHCSLSFSMSVHDSSVHTTKG